MLVMKDEACSVPCCLGVGGNKGRGRCTWARVWGAVCDLAQSQPERSLSSGCSAFHLLADGGGLTPGLCPSARCSSGPHVEQRCCLVARGCVPVSLHLVGSWAQLEVCWESWGWAGLSPSVWDAAVGSGYLSLSALPFLPLLPLCIHQKSPVHYMQLCCQPTVLQGNLTFLGLI